MRRPGAARARARAAAHALALLFACAAPCAPQAQPAEAVAAASVPQQLLVTLHVNGVERGEFRVARIADGDYWLRAADLSRLELRPAEGARREFAGDTWYSARALGARRIALEEGQLALLLDFRAETLPGTRIDLSGRPAPLQRSAAQNSFVLSYHLSAIRPGRGRDEFVAAAELNARVEGVLLRQETRLDTASGRKGFVRGATQIVLDKPAEATRLVLGDVVSSAGAFGTTITGAGMLLGKLYDLAPELVHQAGASIQASTTLPADVEVSVDGSTLYRGRVGPGPILLDDLLLNGGARTVRVVVTDAAGRREVIERPFFFTDSVLARGLQEYSYFLGGRSELQGDGGFRYREPAWQALHRWGAGDDVTLAAGGEGSTHFRTVGAGITLRKTIGLLSVDLLSNVDRDRDTSARGWSARYTWLTPRGSFVLGRRRFGPGFRSFVPGTEFLFPREETRIGFATSLWRLQVSADWVRTVTDRETRRDAFLRVSTNLARNITLFGELQKTRADAGEGWAFNLFVRAELDRQRWNSASWQSGPAGRVLEVETGKQTPDGEGIGYRVGSSLESRRDHGFAAPFAQVEWNTRPATLGLFARAPLDSSPTFVQADVSGAIVGLGGYVGFTRQVTDSFLLARLGVPQPGVEILLDHQPQGRTNARGELFIPQVSSSSRHEVSVNDQDLAIRYTLPEQRLLVAPAYRSGHVLDFGIHRVRAVAGQAWVVDAGRRTPVPARAWEMKGPAAALKIETGADGDFYVDDAPPGSYRGTLQGTDRTYACRMTVPEFTEPVHALKGGIVCD